MSRKTFRAVPGMEKYMSDNSIYKCLIRQEKKQIIQEEGGRPFDLHDRAYMAMTERYGMHKEQA